MKHVTRSKTFGVVMLLAFSLVGREGMAGSAASRSPSANDQPELFVTLEPGRAQRWLGPAPATGYRNRFYSEIDGARWQAENWLRDAGFSLLEQRDGEGRRSYNLLSEALLTDWPEVRLHARLGRPVLSAGIDARNDMPALGLTVPWGGCALELEGLNDNHLGWMMMTQARWNADKPVQYGIAVPMMLRGGPSLGLLFQVRVRLGK